MNGYPLRVITSSTHCYNGDDPSFVHSPAALELL